MFGCSWHADLVENWNDARVKPKLQIEKFTGDTTASVAVVFAIAAVAMVMVAGLAIDYISLIRHRTELQAAADASAIAGAREINLATSDTSHIMVVAENFARTNLGLSVKSSGSSEKSGSTGYLTDASAPSMLSASSSDGGSGSDGGGTGSGHGDVAVTTTVNDDASSITVAIERTWTPYFARIFSTSSPSVKASATAQLVGTGKICVLALDETSAGAVSLTKKADLEAAQCGVYSNSTHTSGIVSTGTSLLKANLTCSAGGVSGTGGNFAPYPTTDCPPLPDPLADRQPPVVGPCDFNDYVAWDWEETLQPGVYCGGIEIGQGIVATFEPGVYIIKDGPFVVASNAVATGDNVGFYLVGDSATFGFTSKATVEFTAPKDGDLAGILFFEDRNAPLLRDHEILSENARILLGTFYLPNGRLVVKTAKPVADQSAYTAIVTRQLSLELNPTLVLNTDYSATNIPVPTGLSGVGGRIVLSK